MEILHTIELLRDLFVLWKSGESFFFFFNVGHFKSIEFATIVFLFYVVVFWPWGKWDFSLPTRD